MRGSTLRAYRSAKGFTLIELLVAMVIMLAAIAAASAVFVAGASLVTNAQRQTDDNSNARLASDQILVAIQAAGFGAQGGVCVNSSGAAAFVSPIFGIDGNTSPAAGAMNAASSPDTTTTTPAQLAGTDDLWVLVPDKTALDQSNKTGTASSVCHCVNPKTGTTPPLAGAATSLALGATASSTTLSVMCTGSMSATAGADGNFLEVTNGTTAALLTVNAISAAESCGPPIAPGTFTYHESSLSNYSDSAAHGFQLGDMVFGAKLLHFWIGNDNTGNPELYEATGVASGTNDFYGRPFTGTQTASISGIEDLQIAYGFDTQKSGNPDTYTWQNGMVPSPLPAGPLVALRVTVIARDAVVAVDSRSTNSLQFDPTYSRPAAENHTAGTADGYQRSIYTRVISLGNLTPSAI